VPFTYLRVGNSYQLDKHTSALPLKENEEFILEPNSSVSIETMESVNFPETRFGHIVPKVKLLQKGISNTSSKIDPGYNGFLYVTVFNLGKKPISLRREDRFCSLYVIEVGKGVIPYSKPQQKHRTTGSQAFWERFVDFGERRATFLNVLLTFVTLLLTFANIAVIVQQLRITQQTSPTQTPMMPSQTQQSQPLP
jgi:deoxycytidine triphosphate deaminase